LHRLTLLAFGLAGVLRLTAAPPAASLEQQLNTKYPIGSTLVIQQPGVVGSSPCTSPLIPTAEYKEDGQLHRPGKMQLALLRSAMCGLRDFPVGWKVTLGAILVNHRAGKVAVRFVECDTCNSPAPSASFRAEVELDFGKGALDTTDPAKVQEVLGKVFTVDTSAPPQAAAAQQAAAPEAPPAPPPALGPIYISSQNGANRLLLNPDGTFLLQEDGQAYTGNYAVNGTALNMHIVQLNKDVPIAINGSQLIVNDSEVWVQPGQQAAAPPPAAGPPTVRKGDSFDQVKGKMGPPDNIMDLGEKVIYVYKNLKITFIAGAVANIE